MPYASEKQRRFMYSQHPRIAKKWNAEGNNYIKKSKPKKKNKNNKYHRYNRGLV